MASNIVIPKLSECVCGAIKKPTFLIIEFFSSSEILIRYFIKSSFELLLVIAKNSLVSAMDFDKFMNNFKFFLLSFLPMNR